MKKFNTASTVSVFVSLCILGFTGPLTALAAGPAAVNLGSAGNFTILSKAGISTTGSSVVVGDIGVSPIMATGITGFGLTMDVSNAFSISALVTGRIYAPDYATPTPATMTTAVANMETAYTDAAGRTNPTATELGAGNIGGLTLAPGLYKWGTNVIIPADVTLSGSAQDVWIMQIGQNLTVSSGVHVILSGGAQASNIFWVVAGQTTVGTGAVVNGAILDQTAIVLNTGAQLNGRALAQTAVTLDSNIITAPTYAVPAPAATTTPAPTPMYTPAPISYPTQNSNSSVTGTNNAAAQAQLAGLQATLQSLQAQHAAQQGASASAFGQQVRAIAVNLGKGKSGTPVAVLQQFLISQNKGPRAQALAKAGATAYFGGVTQSALAEFQASVGISPASGNFGPLTRAYVSTH